MSCLRACLRLLFVKSQTGSSCHPSLGYCGALENIIRVVGLSLSFWTKSVVFCAQINGVDHAANVGVDTNRG